MLSFDVFSNPEACTMSRVKRPFGLFLPVLAVVALSVFIANTARADITWGGEVNPANPTTLTYSPEYDVSTLTVGYADPENPGWLTVAAGSTLGTGFAFIGYGTDSSGTVTITGAGSTWTALGILVAGENGPGYGRLNVADHALVNIPDVPGYGNISIGSVSGSGNPTGGGGTVSITSGGTISSLGSSQDTIGVNVPGVMNVDGAGSTWLSLHPMIGWTTSGTLNITNGGSVISNGSYGVSLGRTRLCDSIVATVDGKDPSGNASTWTIGGSNQLQVGNQSPATLNLSNGGTVIANTVIGGMVGPQFWAQYGITVAGGSMTINFNGGVLKSNGPATSTSGDWISVQNVYGAGTEGTGVVYIKDGGGAFDTNGNDMRISMPLQHGGLSATDGGVTKLGLGTLTLNGANTYTGRTTVQAGVLELGAAAQSVVLTGGTGGADIRGGKMVFDYSGFAPDVGSLLHDSYGAGGAAAWTTGQFLSGTKDSAHGLGWTDSGSNVTVMYTLYGDGDLNGTVNGADLNTVLSNYNKTGQYWYQGDFDYNGTVNGADLNTVLSNYNQHLSSIGAAVPEPSTLLLAAAGLVGLTTYAWRKRK